MSYFIGLVQLEDIQSDRLHRGKHRNKIKFLYTTFSIVEKN